MATQIDSIKTTCLSCCRTLGERQFYKTTNDKYKQSNGFIPFCKDCIVDGFKKSYSLTNSVKQSIIATAMRYDIPYDERNIPSHVDADSTTVEEAVTVWYEFIKMTNSVGKKLLSKDAFDYENFVGKLLTRENVEKSEEKKLYVTSTLDIPIDDDIINFFGSGFTISQYKFLLKDFLQLANSYKCEDYATELIFKDLAFFNLKIAELKANSSSEKEIISLIEARRKLMVDSNIQNKDTKSDNELALGNLIRRMEKTRPADDPLPEWENNKLHQLGILIAGHMKSVEGISDSITEEYEELIKEYNIDFNESFADIEGNSKEDTEDTDENE